MDGIIYWTYRLRDHHLSGPQAQIPAVRPIRLRELRHLQILSNTVGLTEERLTVRTRTSVVPPMLDIEVSTMIG